MLEYHMRETVVISVHRHQYMYPNPSKYDVGIPHPQFNPYYVNDIYM